MTYKNKCRNSNSEVHEHILGYCWIYNNTKAGFMAKIREETLK